MKKYKYLDDGVEDLHSFLIKKRYMVMSTVIDTLDEHAIRNRGFVQSGIKKFDDRIPYQQIAIMIPISSMVEKFSMGQTINFVNSNDMLEVYEAIYYYLKQSRDRIERDISLQSIPLGEYQYLARFAEWINTVVGGIDLGCDEDVGSMQRSIYSITQNPFISVLDIPQIAVAVDNHQTKLKEISPQVSNIVKDIESIAHYRSKQWKTS